MEEKKYETYFRVTVGGTFEDFPTYPEAETFLREKFDKGEFYGAIKLIKFEIDEE